MTYVINPLQSPADFWEQATPLAQASHAGADAKKNLTHAVMAFGFFHPKESAPKNDTLKSCKSQVNQGKALRHALDTATDCGIAFEVVYNKDGDTVTDGTLFDAIKAGTLSTVEIRTISQSLARFFPRQNLPMKDGTLPPVADTIDAWAKAMESVTFTPAIDPALAVMACQTINAARPSVNDFAALQSRADAGDTVAASDIGAATIRADALAESKARAESADMVDATRDTLRDLLARDADAFAALMLEARAWVEQPAKPAKPAKRKAA